MQMTSYLDTSIILIRETFPTILVKIRRCDVMWRHVTSFLQNWLKNGWKMADIIKMFSNSCLYLLFGECGFIIPFKRGVNHFYTIHGSVVIVFLVYVNFCRFFDDVINKNGDISRNNDVTQKILMSSEIFQGTS